MRTVFRFLAALALVSSAAMYVIGSESSHLSELRAAFWLPIPLAVVFGILGRAKRDA